MAQKQDEIPENEGKQEDTTDSESKQTKSLAASRFRSVGPPRRAPTVKKPQDQIAKTQQEEKKEVARESIRVTSVHERNLTYNVDDFKIVRDKSPSLNPESDGTGPLHNVEGSAKKFNFAAEDIGFYATLSPQENWGNQDDWKFGFVQNIVAGHEYAVYGGHQIDISDPAPILDSSAPTKQFPWAHQHGSGESVASEEKQRFGITAQQGQVVTMLNDKPGVTLPHEITIDDQKFPFEKYAIDQTFVTCLVAYNSKDNEMVILDQYQWHHKAELVQKDDEFCLMQGSVAHQAIGASESKMKEFDGETITQPQRISDPPPLILTEPSTLSTPPISTEQIRSSLGVTAVVEQTSTVANQLKIDPSSTLQ